MPIGHNRIKIGKLTKLRFDKNLYKSRFVLQNR